MFHKEFKSNPMQNIPQNRQSPAILNHHNPAMLERDLSHIHRTGSPAIHIPAMEHGGGILHTTGGGGGSSTLADMQAGCTMLKVTYEKPNRVAALQEEAERTTRRSR